MLNTAISLPAKKSRFKNQPAIPTAFHGFNAVSDIDFLDGPFPRYKRTITFSMSSLTRAVSHKGGW